MKKYFIITYGCQMNWSDSERIAAVLEKIGYKPASNENEADLIVINMCSIRQSAVNRVYGKIENFTKPKNILRRKNLKILLTGCILEKDIRNFKDKVDYIFPIKSLSIWKQFLKEKKIIYYPNQRDLEFNKKFSLEYFKICPRPHYYASRAKCFSAFVPISTGCDNFCSYCVVPYLRGPEISRPVEDIISEVKNLVEKGYKEVWLLGQNVNSYKSQIQKKRWLHSGNSPVEPLAQDENCNLAPQPFGTMEPAFIPNCSKSNPKPKIQKFKLVNFSTLLKMVNNIPGDFWIRFISPHPKDFSDELIKTMAKCEKVTPYLNLPVQSGDNEILKKMNRSYTIEQYKKLVKKIRKEFIKIRGKSVLFCLTTDIIVGFQGETKKQFENTVKLFKEIKFDMAYISQYSSRPGTVALNLEDNISQKEKKERDEILTEILKKTALENNKKYIGRKTEALLEFEKNGWLIGKTREYKTVKIKIQNPNTKPNPNAKIQKVIGDFVKVKIIEANSWGLKGDVS